MVKMSVGRELKTPPGSLRSLTGLWPVFATVVMTFVFSDPSPFKLRNESVTVQLASIVRAGAAETAAAEATMPMATREARREEKSIVMQVVKGAEEATPMNPWDRTNLA